MRTAVVVPMLAAALCALLTAGPAVAQSYHNLETAVPDLARRLVSEANLTGHRVLVTSHDFFEEHTRRRLLLSETLNRRFRSALSGHRVLVVTDAENADEMRVLQGEWSLLADGEIDLSVWIRRRIGEDHVSQPVRGHVRHVAPDRLRSDLPFLGRHLVRALEREVRDRRVRRVRVGDFTIMGAGARQNDVQSYLEAFWLTPAFAGSRLFRLADASSQGGRSDGVLRVTAFVGSAAVRVSVDVRDTGQTQVSAATVEMPRELLRDVLDPNTPSTLTVRTEPANARVRVITSTGAGYRDAMPLAPGQYEVEVEAGSHEPFQRSLSVDGPTTYRISLCRLETRTQRVCRDQPVTRHRDEVRETTGAVDETESIDMRGYLETRGVAQGDMNGAMGDLRRAIRTNPKKLEFVKNAMCGIAKKKLTGKILDNDLRESRCQSSGGSYVQGSYGEPTCSPCDDISIRACMAKVSWSCRYTETVRVPNTVNESVCTDEDRTRRVCPEGGTEPVAVLVRQ